MSVQLRPPSRAPLHQALASTPLALYAPHAELLALDYALKGEERDAIGEIIAAVASTITSMPRTYQTDGLGDAVIVHLHYFKAGSHWYITELDLEGDGRLQAFGYAILNGDTMNAELGYISIEELVDNGVELDLYWTKRTLGELKQQVLQ